jgi:hypothetical protein
VTPKIYSIHPIRLQYVGLCVRTASSKEDALQIASYQFEEMLNEFDCISEAFYDEIADMIGFADYKDCFDFDKYSEKSPCVKDENFEFETYVYGGECESNYSSDKIDTFYVISRNLTRNREISRNIT